MSDTAGNPTCACRDCNQAELLKVIRRRHDERLRDEVAEGIAPPDVSRNRASNWRNGEHDVLTFLCRPSPAGLVKGVAALTIRSGKSALVRRRRAPYHASASIWPSRRAPKVSHWLVEHFLSSLYSDLARLRQTATASTIAMVVFSLTYSCAFARMRADTDNSTPSPIRLCRRARNTRHELCRARIAPCGQRI